MAEAADNVVESWTATDSPLVRLATDPTHSCLGCGAWSQWIGECGDCMLHALKRRGELLTGVAREDRTPARAARMTSGDETCDGWTPIRP